MNDVLDSLLSIKFVVGIHLIIAVHNKGSFRGSSPFDSKLPTHDQNLYIPPVVEKRDYEPIPQPIWMQPWPSKKCLLTPRKLGEHLGP